jgi:hypothetical protein
MLNELNDSQFRATLVQPVRRIPEADKPDVDVNAYLKACDQRYKLLVNRSDFVFVHIYAGADGCHVHIALWYGREDRALVLVLDAPQKEIRGHYFLNLKDDTDATGLLALINSPRQGGPPCRSAAANKIELE